MEINESLSEESEQLKKNEEKNRGENTLNVKFAWTKKLECSISKVIQYPLRHEALKTLPLVSEEIRPYDFVYDRKLHRSSCFP
ncbi:8959_t:CDS:2, partial [Entrophospora sp. SA101]